MKKTILILILLCLALFLLVAAPESRPSAGEILAAIDRNMVYETAYAEIEMILTVGRRTLSKSMSSYSSGNRQSLIEFHEPARDRGTKILKLDDVIQVYYPSAERVLRLSGHMLRQSMMGSDFSYEDMTERASRLKEAYEAELLEDEMLEDRPCFVLQLSSRDGRQTYHSRRIWVDRELYFGRREELYARSGKLLKVLTVNETAEIGGRVYPVRLTMEDKLRNDSRTEMIVRKIVFDVEIPPGTFSERNLLKK